MPLLLGKHGHSVRPRDLLTVTQSISEEGAGASWCLFGALLFILTCSLGFPGLWISPLWDPPTFHEELNSLVLLSSPSLENFPLQKKL